MTDIALLPCPHCGGKAELHTHQIAEDAVEAFVMCSACFATTDNFEDTYAPTADAIAAWNRRSSPSQVASANPAQVTDAMVEIGLRAAEEACMEHTFGTFREDSTFETAFTDEFKERFRLIHRAALTAAIGAGGQAVADAWDRPIEEISRIKAGKFFDGAPNYKPIVAGDREKFIDENWSSWREDAIAEVLALSQPHPTDERVEAGRRRAVGQGMAIAAGIVMNGWGNTVYAKEILGAAGYTSVEAMKADGVEDYDIDLCRPALDELSAKEAR